MWRKLNLGGKKLGDSKVAIADSTAGHLPRIVTIVT